MRTFVFLPHQKPVNTSFVSRDKFLNSFLLSSTSLYPRSNDDLQWLKDQREKGIQIGHQHKIESFLTPLPGGKTTYHNGYLHYLLAAWKSDCGIEVGPWHIWNIVLHQLCAVVKDKPDLYRTVFTRSSEKIEITFSDGDMFDIHRFINALTEHLPVDVNQFLPLLPNAPAHYREAMLGLFADMVQEYYSCMIYGCSLPKVRVLGTDQEWEALVTILQNLIQTFDSRGAPTSYLRKAQTAVQDLIVNLDRPEYWKEFFFVRRCGSGSQEEVQGRVLEFMTDSSMLLISEIPNMVSRYPFTYKPGVDGCTDLAFVGGIFWSNLDEEGYLVPEYTTNITVKNPDLCKLSEQELAHLDILIEARMRLLKYSSEYLPNHSSIVRPIFPADGENLVKEKAHSFEEYWHQHCFYYRTHKRFEDNNITPYMKAYAKHVENCYTHNTLVDLVGNDMTAYLEKANEQRIAKMKTTGEYCVWQPDLNITDKRYRSLPVVTATVYESVHQLQQANGDVQFLVSHFDVLYDYISNHFSCYKSLVQTLNPVLLRRFFENYLRKPFVFNWSDFSNGSCSSDPIVESLDYSWAFYHKTGNVPPRPSDEQMLWDLLYLTLWVIESKVTDDVYSRIVSELLDGWDISPLIQVCIQSGVRHIKNIPDLVGIAYDYRRYNMLTTLYPQYRQSGDEFLAALNSKLVQNSIDFVITPEKLTAPITHKR